MPDADPPAAATGRRRELGVGRVLAERVGDQVLADLRRIGALDDVLLEEAQLALDVLLERSCA